MVLAIKGLSLFIRHLRLWKPKIDAQTMAQHVPVRPKHSKLDHRSMSTFWRLIEFAPILGHAMKSKDKWLSLAQRNGINV